MNGNLVCRCMNINKDAIVKAIETGSAKTVEEIGKKTGAGTGCGRCKVKIQEILNEYNK